MCVAVVTRRTTSSRMRQRQTAGPQAKLVRLVAEAFAGPASMVGHLHAYFQARFENEGTSGKANATMISMNDYQPWRKQPSANLCPFLKMGDAQFEVEKVEAITIRTQVHVTLNPFAKFSEPPAPPPSCSALGLWPGILASSPCEPLSNYYTTV